MLVTAVLGQSVAEDLWVVIGEDIVHVGVVRLTSSGVSDESEERLEGLGGGCRLGRGRFFYGVVAQIELRRLLLLLLEVDGLRM